MGNTFTINMEENFKKNQEFITEMNTIKVCCTVFDWYLILNMFFFRLKDSCKWETKWEKEKLLYKLQSPENFFFGSVPFILLVSLGLLPGTYRITNEYIPRKHTY